VVGIYNNFLAIYYFPVLDFNSLRLLHFPDNDDLFIMSGLYSCFDHKSKFPASFFKKKKKKEKRLVLP
jgi:hypothetical protein